MQRHNDRTTSKYGKIVKRLLLSLTAIIVLILLAVVTIIAVNQYVQTSAKERIISPAEATLIDFDFDCILILGAGVRNDKRPSHMLEDRLLRGIELYEQGVADRLLMSGDHGQIDYDEVNVMKQFAIDKGIPSEHIFMDHAGFSTYESMYRAKEIFTAEKILVVTQEYHLYRALYIADALGLTAYGVDADLRTYIGQEYREFREVLARMKDFLTTLYKPKPTYLGETIPIHGNGDLTND